MGAMLGLTLETMSPEITWLNLNDALMACDWYGCPNELLDGDLLNA